MKTGIIGPGSQARKLVLAAEEIGQGLSYVVFRHREGLDLSFYEKRGARAVNDLSGLSGCDAIIIASANEAHFESLKSLFESGYEGYIFLEKPPVTTSEGLEWLRKADDELKKRIYFNFNYRHSPYAKSFKDDGARFGLGRMLNATVITGHGIGLKRDYAGTWRAKAGASAGGVFENVSIHFIDMLVSLYGAPERFAVFNSNFSPYGDAADNSAFSCRFCNGATLNVVASYTTAFISSVTAIYDNGAVVFGEDKKVYAPRETFDESGMFAQPPVIHSESVPRKEIAKASLRESMKEFIGIVKGKKGVSHEWYDAGIETNRVAIEALNEYLTESTKKEETSK